MKTINYLKNGHKILVSLDIHQSNIYMYALNIETGEILEEKNFFDGWKSILRKLNKLGIKKDIEILYEAGNQGFAPWRKLTRNGYLCRVIAPSSIPRKPKDQKTDRDDAIKILNYHIAGVLRYVDVPSAQEEAIRDCLRYRSSVVHRIVKKKQRIQCLTKRYELKFNLTKSNWTKLHWKWLRTVDAAEPVRLVLDCHLQDLEEAESKLSRIDEKLDAMMQKNPLYTQKMAIYQLIPGIGRVNAMTAILEGRDLGRFRTPGKMVNYVGLIPGKYASGSSDPHLRITKAGNKYFRTAMVGSAKFFRDRRYTIQKRVLSDLPVHIKEFLERLQNRLFGRYRYLVRKGKHSNKAKTAIARELCGFLWELVNVILPKLTNQEIKSICSAR
jgi:transposase